MVIYDIGDKYLSEWEHTCKNDTVITAITIK